MGRAFYTRRNTWPQKQNCTFFFILPEVLFIHLIVTQWLHKKDNIYTWYVFLILGWNVPFLRVAFEPVIYPLSSQQNHEWIWGEIDSVLFINFYHYVILHTNKLNWTWLTLRSLFHTSDKEQEMHYGPQVIKKKCLQGRLSDYFLKLQLVLFFFFLIYIINSLQVVYKHWYRLRKKILSLP